RVHQTRHLLQEVLIQQQGRQLRVSLIGIDDAVEETGADDAATTPDAGQVPGVDVPTVFFRTREDLVEALGIGDHLRRVKRATDVLNEVRRLGGIHWGSQLTGSELALGGLACRAIRGERAGKHRLTDTGDRDAQVAGGLHGPAARALLAGSVHDDVHQRLAGFGIDLRQDLRGDLHEVGLQLAGVPLAENLGDLLRAQPRPVAQQVVSLADDLHIRVLDTVVDHLDEVASAVRADVGAARLAINLRGNGLQQRAWGLVGLGGATRHDRWAVQGALLAAGNAGADEVQAAGGDLLLAADRVRVQGVATIDDDVTRVHEFGELLDHGIGGWAGLHHNQRAARLFEGSHEGLQGLGWNERTLLAEVLHEALGAGESAVENRHG